MENPDFIIHMMRSHDAIQLYATSCLQQIASFGQTFTLYFFQYQTYGQIKISHGDCK